MTATSSHGCLTGRVTRLAAVYHGSGPGKLAAHFVELVDQHPQERSAVRLRLKLRCERSIDLPLIRFRDWLVDEPKGEVNGADALRKRPARVVESRDVVKHQEDAGLDRDLDRVAEEPAALDLVPAGGLLEGLRAEFGVVVCLRGHHDALASQLGERGGQPCRTFNRVFGDRERIHHVGLVEVVAKRAAQQGFRYPLTVTARAIIEDAEEVVVVVAKTVNRATVEANDRIT